MTQQTQVSRVVPLYHAFLARFPTPAACAAAPLGDVLRAWQGLGYNRRARHLHAAARWMVAEFGGRVPDELSALQTAPGVGPYTARAVLAFAFDRDVGVLDTNAGRVVARAAAGRPLGRAEAQRTVDGMVPTGRGWEFGQALLDLGATVCVAGEPRCAACPVRRRCRWAAGGRRAPDPASGSAGVGRRQSPFAGSDRQARGRLVDVLRHHRLAPDEIADAMGLRDDRQRARRLSAGLVEEGLVVRSRDGSLSLP